jgi:hypothetical protein
MPDAPLPARRFTETDTDAILRRTAELASGAEAGPGSRGLTIDEMESLASEAGLDPELVRRAAQEISLREAQRLTPWLGAPRRVLLERTLPGELSEDAWEAMVGEVQRSLGSLGFPARVGRSRSWSVGGAGPSVSHRSVSITTSIQDGNTILRVEESLHHLAGGLFGGLVGGLGGGTTGLWIGLGLSVLHSPAAAIGLVLAGLSGSYLLARTVFARVAHRRAVELDRLLDRLEEIARTGGR